MKSDYSNETVELLTNLDNYEIALAIADCVNLEGPRILRKFWENVKTEVNSRVAAGSHSGGWEARLSPNVDSSGSWLAILPLSSAVPSDSVGNDLGCYAITIHDLADKPESCYYGIRRPSNNAEIRTLLDNRICEMLQRDGFKQGFPWWCGWRYAGEDAQLPRERRLVLLNIDNRQESGMAIRVAHCLWKLFDRYAELLQEMNSALLAKNDA